MPDQKPFPAAWRNFTPPALLLVFFAVIYALISLVNHYFFRTYALDLGLYTNSLYDYSHLQWNDSSVFKPHPENLLADHFDLWLPILSPLSFIFRTYTLLLVQIAFILFGAYGVYRYFILKKPELNPARFALLYFLFFFGVFAGVSFDYHSNVIAAMLTPWFFCSVLQRNFRKATVYALLILIAKENMALWLCFICFGLLIEYRRDKIVRQYLIVTAGLSLVYFFLITNFVMPALSVSGKYAHFDYSVLGTNAGDAILYLLKHPVDSFHAFFTNHTNNVRGDYVKAELHIVMLLLGVPILFFKPQYLIMLIPVYIQKMFHNSPSIWGIDGQYSIEFAPIMAIGVFDTLSGLMKKQTTFYFACLLMTILSLLVTIRIMDQTMLSTNKSRIRLYQASHYSRNYDVQFVHKQLKLIPPDAIVSAQSPFLPHLSLRDKIYCFPIIKDAEYVIYSVKEDTYPQEKSDFVQTIFELKMSGKWKVIVDTGDLTILKRTENNITPIN